MFLSLAASSPNSTTVGTGSGDAGKLIGYAAAHNDFDALVASGFERPTQTGYCQDFAKRDMWTYIAANAANIILTVTKL